jgi:hypothetical protein
MQHFLALEYRITCAIARADTTLSKHIVISLPGRRSKLLICYQILIVHSLGFFNKTPSVYYLTELE